MAVTPPEAPPRREWALARYLRRGGNRGALVFVALLLWGVLYAVSGRFVPFSRSDAPGPREEAARCLRQGGVWSYGRVGGQSASWCSVGPR